MHKYQPRIHLVLRREGAINAPITDLEQEEFKTFIFPECVFTAVTAYQNQLVSIPYNYLSFGYGTMLLTTSSANVTSVGNRPVIARKLFIDSKSLNTGVSISLPPKQISLAVLEWDLTSAEQSDFTSI